MPKSRNRRKHKERVEKRRRRISEFQAQFRNTLKKAYTSNLNLKKENVSRETEEKQNEGEGSKNEEVVSEQS